MRIQLAAAVFVCFAAAEAHAVTSRVRYEEANASINSGDGYKTSNNENATLAWGESYIMMSYMAMYRATGDTLYLDRLADHADHVHASRDDVAGVTEFNGKSSACWRCTKYQPNNEPYCYVVHSGMLTYPMADLSALIYETPALWEVATYDGSTYKEKADLFVARVEEVVAYHDFQWHIGPGVGQGHYVFDPAASFLDHAGDEMPLNQQNAMGRTLVALYLATGKAEYLQKAIGLANRFAAALALQGSGAYAWNYWGGGYSAPGEDISHAAINVDFARICGEHGIVFSETDLRRFGNTFFKNVYKDSSTLADNVGGTGSTNGGSYKPQCGRWVPLSPYHPSVYAIVRNIYDSYDTATGSGSVVLGFANLALYEPKAVPHFFYYVDWADKGTYMKATAQNANILATPLDPSQRVMTPITYRSTFLASVQQWDDVVYHEVARFAGTGGAWKTLWLAYHPDHWHPYWTGGALYQFSEFLFLGIDVKKAEELALPEILTDALPLATIGEAWSADLEGAGDGPLAWALLEAPPGMTVQWDSGALSWPAPDGPPGTVAVEVLLDSDYGSDAVVFELLVESGEPPTPDMVEPYPDVVEPYPDVVDESPEVVEWAPEIISGTDLGAEAGTDLGAEPGTDLGAEPGTDLGTEPGTDLGAGTEHTGPPPAALADEAVEPAGCTCRMSPGRRPVSAGSLLLVLLGALVLGTCAHSTSSAPRRSRRLFQVRWW